MPVLPLSFILEHILFVSSLALCYSSTDGLLRQKKVQDFPWRRALIDNSCHIALGFLSWLIVVSVEEPRSRWVIPSSLLCGLCAGFVDIDHFIQARSIHLNDVLNCPRRPFLHNTTLVLFSTISMISITRFLNQSKLEYFSWILLVAFVSHHVRDASHRGLWLWPSALAPFDNYSCVAINYIFSICIGCLKNHLYKPTVFPDVSLI